MWIRSQDGTELVNCDNIINFTWRVNAINEVEIIAYFNHQEKQYTSDVEDENYIYLGICKTEEEALRVLSNISYSIGAGTKVFNMGEI